jgi:hypothetical protein
VSPDEIFVSSYEDSDLIGGWRYSATLQLQTPLAYLEMDGEFSSGPKQPPLVGPAVNFLDDGKGFNPYGIWLPEIDYEGMGFIPPPPGQRAAEHGPVRIGSTEEKELLSFLKSFRYIVETAETLDQMLSELEDLSTSTPGNRRVWARYSEGDSLWPDSYFIRQLWMRLPKGVGPSKAENLYLAGFRTFEEIQAASDGDLLKVEGFGKGLLRKLRTPDS